MASPLVPRPGLAPARRRRGAGSPSHSPPRAHRLAVSERGGPGGCADRCHNRSARAQRSRWGRRGAGSPNRTPPRARRQAVSERGGLGGCAARCHRGPLSRARCAPGPPPRDRCRPALAPGRRSAGRAAGSSRSGAASATPHGSAAPCPVRAPPLAHFAAAPRPLATPTPLAAPLGRPGPRPSRPPDGHRRTERPQRCRRNAAATADRRRWRRRRSGR
mmetsp:Transcript_12706/g.36552  ORF Transcript_12706/g.36552 Transcript_12706/m.36552 type:complete len:218 (-) Transcript_12706:82-735(-)